jgi:hypothetical protein
MHMRLVRTLVVSSLAAVALLVVGAIVIALSRRTRAS